MKEQTVSNSAHESFSDALNKYGSPKPATKGELLHGIVIDVLADLILVDIGMKREGHLPKDDVEEAGKRMEEFAPGEDIEVVVTEEGRGAKNPALSINQVIQNQAWQDAVTLMESGKIFTGTVESCNRGGLVVSYQGLSGFVPASHFVGVTRSLSEADRRTMLEQSIGQEISLRVIEVDRLRHRLVLSQRAAQHASRAEKKEELFAGLSEGQVMRGTITGVRDYGAFVNLGAADGLVHVSEIAWRPIEHPSESVQPGDEVDVMVIKIDRKLQRIGLSLKQLLPSPWDSADDWIVPGETIVGHVTRVLRFGAFVDLGNGIEGLLPSNNIPTEDGPEIAPGCELLLSVVSLDVERQRVGLSLPNIAAEDKQPDLAEAEAPAETRDEHDRNEASIVSTIDETSGGYPHQEGGD